MKAFTDAKTSMLIAGCGGIAVVIAFTLIVISVINAPEPNLTPDDFRKALYSRKGAPVDYIVEIRSVRFAPNALGLRDWLT